MIKLLDGPVAGTYMVKRAPVFLRAVVARDGKKDVLDQLDDEPSEDETIHVYELIGESGWVHINMGRKGSGFYATGDYRHVPMDGEAVRPAIEWRAWCVIEANTRREPQA